MKRVLHIITRLDRGGSTEDVLLTAARLGPPAYEHIILHGLTREAPAALLAAAMRNGTVCRSIPALRREIHPLRDLRAFAGILRSLFELRPDIVHTHTSKAGILGRWAAFLYRLLSRRNVSIVHASHGHVFFGYYPPVRSALILCAERVTAPLADRLVVLTDVERDDHLRRHVGRDRQFAIIHSGIPYDAGAAQDDRAAASWNGIPAGAVVTGSVGRLDPVKGYAGFIAMADLLHRRFPHMYFLLVGDGADTGLIRAMIHRRGLTGHVIMPGWMEDPLPAIRAMDIYVQPSLNEGLGKTVLLAQLLAKPVIATAVQGLTALISHESNGLLVPPGDPRALADAVARLANDPATRARYGAAARARMRASAPGSGAPIFSIEHMVYLYDQLYASL